MIFGKNRRDEEWNQAVRGLETELKEIKESLEKVIVYSKDREEAIGSWQDPVQKLGNLEERQKELERQIRRQSGGQCPCHGKTERAGRKMQGGT